MLEGILYFALGFLSAALLALMVSPAIWNRAVTLTRKRVENSVPLTLNEIQADKDQLRAEFAMSTRRLEMSVEELRERASQQVIEIARKRDDLAKLAEESHDRIKTIEEMEILSSELRAKLKEREERLEIANSRLEETRKRMEENALELDNLRAQLAEVRAEADGRRIELVVKQTELDNLSDKLSDSRALNATEETRELMAQTAKLESALEAEKRKARNAKERYEGVRKQLESVQQSLEQRESELARTREASSADDSTNAQLTSDLLSEKSRTVELEAKLAQSALQMEALLADASNDNVEKAMASLNRDKEILSEKIEAITRERDDLRDKFCYQQSANSEEWEVERRENAILRERMNDLAAQVTAMTAALEGDGSTINEILADTPKPVTEHGKKTRSAANGQAAENNLTLAERIRALQETARQNKTG